MPTKCPSCVALKAQDIEVLSRLFVGITNNLSPLSSNQREANWREELKVTHVHVLRNIADVKAGCDVSRTGLHAVMSSGFFHCGTLG